jgi:hypothetical protein
MDRLLRRALVLTLSAFAAGAFLPGAAAQADPSGCPGFYCLWTKKDFNGKRFVGTTKQLVNLPDFIDDKASSIKWDLPEGKVALLYDRRNGHGTSFAACGKGNEPELLKLDNFFSSAEIINGACA